MTTLNQIIAGLNPDIQKELAYYAAIENSGVRGYFDELCKRMNEQ